MPEDKAAARGWRVVVVYTFVFATNLYTNQNKPLPAFFNSMWEKDEISWCNKARPIKQRHASDAL